MKNWLAHLLKMVFPVNQRRKRTQTSQHYQTLEARQLLAILTVNTISDLADGSTDGQISLREAIIAANSNAAFGDAPAGDITGDYIQFDPSLDGQTITLDGSELSITDDLVIRTGNNDITIDANRRSRIFSIDTAERVNLVGLTMTGGLENEGGAVFIQGGGDVGLFRITATGNETTSIFSGGGALFNVDSNLIIWQANFTSNTSFGQGGAIFSAQGTVHVSESEIYSNTSQIGGGGILMVQGDLFVNQSDLRFNEVVQTEGVPPGTPDDTFGKNVERAQIRESGGGIAYAGDNSISVIVRSNIRQNIVNSSGGGIFNAEGNQVFIFNGSRIASNIANSVTSTSGGGGIYNEGFTRMGGSSIENNNAEDGSGGGVLSRGGRVWISTSEINDNSSGDDGGGIASVDTNLWLATVELRRNVAGPFSSTPHQITSGGGVFIAGSESALIQGSVFQFNEAGDYGGGIANHGTASINATFFGGNIAQSADTTIDAGGGGAIYHAGELLRLHSSTLQNNSALREVGNGGALLATTGKVEMGFVNFYHNRAEGNGGAIALTGGNMSIFDSNIGTTLNGNSAGQPSGNPLRGGLGGGIYATGSGHETRLLLQGGQVSGNTAIKAGGGMWLGRDTIVRVSAAFQDGTQFQSNRALREDGGGLYSLANNLRLIDAVFENNESRHGAGMMLNDGLTAITGTEIKSNVARQRGGGVYVSLDAAFSQTNSTIDMNEASSGPNLYFAS